MFIICPHTKEKLEVTDLESSINSANTFRKFGIENNDFHVKRRAYWQNIYEQLRALKNE